MKRKVRIISYPYLGMSRMTDTDDNKVLVELYDDGVDQKETLVEFAQSLGYVIIEEVTYERQQ
jgi:hypothetical protein